MWTKFADIPQPDNLTETILLLATKASANAIVLRTSSLLKLKSTVFSNDHLDPPTIRDSASTEVESSLLVVSCKLFNVKLDSVKRMKYSTSTKDNFILFKAMS